MEPNQIHMMAFAVPGDLQQIFHAIESRFARQISSDIPDPNRRNRIHANVAIFHRLASADLHARTGPDAHAASDSSAAYSLAKALCEHHQECPLQAAVNDNSALNPTRRTQRNNPECSVSSVASVVKLFHCAQLRTAIVAKDVRRVALVFSTLIPQRRPCDLAEQTSPLLWQQSPARKRSTTRDRETNRVGE